MKNAILLGICSLLFIGGLQTFANDIFIDAESTLFVSEDLNNDHYYNNQNAETIEYTIEEHKDNDAESALAKEFVRSYNIVNFNDQQEHSAMSDKDFFKAASNFINLVLGGRTQIIPNITNTKGDFIDLIGRPLFNECINDACIREHILSNHIVNKSYEMERSITYSQASLILWRSYLYHKHQTFQQNVLSLEQINISRLIQANRFDDLELIWITNDQNSYHTNSLKKNYNVIDCYYQYTDSIITASCEDQSNTPFYIVERKPQYQTLEEKIKLNTKSKELFLSKTSYF